MAKWALVVVGLVVAGRTAAATPRITTSDIRSTSELRAGSTEVISHDLGARLAKASCTGCHVDASVTKLVVEKSDAGTTVSADIHFTITDEHGIVISMIAGCSRATARREKLVALRDEALRGAIENASPKVARLLIKH